MIPHAIPCFFIFCMENISSQNFFHFYCRQDIILSWSSDIQAVPAHLTMYCYCTHILFLAKNCLIFYISCTPIVQRNFADTV